MLSILRETLKRFLSRFTETTDVLGSFDLDPLEAQDRQLKFQGVRFEVIKASRDVGEDIVFLPGV